MSKLIFIGNCQVDSIADAINSLVGKPTAFSIRAGSRIMSSIISGDEKITALNSSLIELLDDCDSLYVQSKVNANFLIKTKPNIKNKIRILPAIHYSGFHPDIVHIRNKKNKMMIQGPMVNYHSSIVLWSWINGRRIQESIDLFREEIYKQLKYYEYQEKAKQLLLSKSKVTEFPLQNVIDNWFDQGCWMDAPSHPKLFVLIDIVKMILQKENINDFSNINIDNTDKSSRLPRFPVYPDLAKSFKGIIGSYEFKPAGKKSKVYNLEEFIETSFECYSKYSRNDLLCDRLNTSSYRDI